MMGLLRSSVRRSLGYMGAIAGLAKQKVHERQTSLERSGMEMAGGRRDILAKLFELRAQRGEKGDFGIADIQQEGHVGL